MVIQKQRTIKTADFEAKTNALIKEIEETKYITKTAVLALIRAYKEDIIKYGPAEEFTIPKYLEVR